MLGSALRALEGAGCSDAEHRLQHDKALQAGLQTADDCTEVSGLPCCHAVTTLTESGASEHSLRKVGIVQAYTPELNALGGSSGERSGMAGVRELNRS